MFIKKYENQLDPNFITLSQPARGSVDFEALASERLSFFQHPTTGIWYLFDQDSKSFYHCESNYRITPFEIENCLNRGTVLFFNQLNSYSNEKLSKIYQ